MSRRRPDTFSLNRRTLLGGGVAAGAATLAVAGGHRGLRSVAAQTPSAFTREASITSWGFGVEETNPLAFARVEAFRQAYPSIQLEVVPEADDQKILTAAAGDTMPDLLWLNRFAIPFWAARGVLQPIGEFVERDQYDTGRFYENAIAEATFEDELYGIPGGMDVRVIYVNNDALAEIGVDPATVNTGNWEQLTDLGAQLFKGSADQVERWGFNHKIEDGAIYAWGNANGAQFLSDDGSEATFTDEKVVETLEWGTAAYDAQQGYQALQAVKTTWQGDEQFARGQVAITMYESWMLGIISRTVPTLNFQVLPLLQRNGDQMTGLVGGNAWCIPTGAKDPEAAWEFIKFMHSDETWLIGANAVKAARKEAGQPYIPALTGSKTADQAQIDQVFEPIDPKFDNAVQLFPQVLAASPNREIGESPVGKQIDDIMDAEAVEPALRKERTAQEALEAANDAANEAISAANVP